MSHPPRILVALEWYDHEMHSGVAQYARQAGWVLDNWMVHFGRIPAHWRGDGIIGLVVDPHGDVARFLRHWRRPAVDLVREVPGLKVPRVLADNQAIGRVAAEHLLSCGLKHLAFCYLWGNWVEGERMRGFQQAVEKAGRNFYPLDFTPHPHHRLRAIDDVLRSWMVRQLKRLPQPLGVLGQYDEEALLVMQACQASGLRIPEDVAVVGVDNDVLSCELGPVPLSSVDRRRREHGYQGAALLDRLMHGEKRPLEPIRVAPGPVVVRRSSNVLAVNDPDLTQALRFIAEHYREPNLRVTDVVKATFTTRSRLYQLFEQHIGRSIKAQIRRQRVDHARQLLLTSRQKLYSIARVAGFRDAEHLTRVFKRDLNMAPSQFREQKSGVWP